MRHPLRIWFMRSWNVLVIVGLLGLGYWGHETRWTIPSFAELIHGKRTAEKEASNDESVARERGIVAFDSEEIARQVGIQCAPAVEKDVDLLVRANATIGYDETKVAQLSSRVPGFVWRVSAYQGQFVRKGDVLALIDCPEVGQARIEFMQEFASHQFAAKRLERLQAFVGQGAVSDASLREAELTALETRTRRFNAFQKLQNLGLEFDLSASEKDGLDALAKRVQVLGLSENVLRQLPPHPRTANLAPLFAPFDGVVTQFNVVMGERISADDKEIQIVDVRQMWVRLSVRKEDAGRLAVGQEVLYRSAANNDCTAAGRLTWISTNVDEKTRTVQARAVVANPCISDNNAADEERPRLLRANEYGSSVIKVGAIPRAVLVPNQAIQHLDGDVIVFVVRPDRKSFEARAVEIGAKIDGFTQIRRGVVPGESIVTTNNFVLKSEMMKHSREAP